MGEYNQHGYNICNIYSYLLTTIRLRNTIVGRGRPWQAGTLLRTQMLQAVMSWIINFQKHTLILTWLHAYFFDLHGISEDDCSKRMDSTVTVPPLALPSLVLMYSLCLFLLYSVGPKIGAQTHSSVLIPKSNTIVQLHWHQPLGKP